MSVTQDPLTLLQRVLLLERTQGFQDRAAAGGLAAFVRGQMERWGPSHAGLEAVAQALDGYGEADRRGREAAVVNALRVLLTGSAQKPREQRAAPSPPPAAPPQKPARPRLKIVRTEPDLDLPVTTLKGIGKTVAEPMAKVGIHTVRDLIYYFPRQHYDYQDTRSISRMRLGQPSTLVGTVDNVRNNRTRRGILITTATISDDTGTVAVRWFNQPYMAKQLPAGARVAITGEPDIFNGSVTFQPRDIELIKDEDLTHAGRLVPVYPLTKGLYQRSLRQLIRRTLDECEELDDFLPPGMAEQARLYSLDRALRQYHFPDSEAEKERAQQRLAFDELLLVQLGLLQRKRRWQQSLPYVAVAVDEGLLERFCSGLPFALTAAQRRATAEILEDMSRPVPMSRLLQGDVGSGKTVVAAAALLQVCNSGKQGVLMAPTEILAEQHFRTISQLLSPYGISCELLTGSTSRSERKRILAAAREGIAHVVVGTHALIQQGVEFNVLGLAITDEQHRFGVEQRAQLRAKGLQPHTLAMTATPIPRSLAMTIYGDLDVSSIDEMPPGRIPVITTWAQLPREAYGVVRDEVRQGHQAFVICPVIEESKDTDMRSVLAEHKELQSLVFPDLKVGLLHGKMKAAEKDATLTAFRQGEYHVLVATSVVEVGIDVPNATVMVIRDAHRFGLAQLHQFRGRVGRGGDQAFCVLLSSAEGDEARERLEAVTAIDSGFELAEEDLRLRGPGEFWGTRQSGLPELKVAQLGDIPTINLARTAALNVLKRDPDLTLPEHQPLAERVQSFWTEGSDLS